MNIREQLRRDEGEVLHVYIDSRGIRTAGVGHNLEAHKVDLPVGAVISQIQSDTWLEQDIAQVQEGLVKALPWAVNLAEPRLGVLLNMAFNLGIGGLLGFHKTLGLIQCGDYTSASQSLLQSKWATQVGDRAKRLSKQLKEGVWV